MINDLKPNTIYEFAVKLVKVFIIYYFEEYLIIYKGI